MNTDRLFVARFMLKADLDEIAGFQHLPGRLGEASLVAVNRRDRGEPGAYKVRQRSTSNAKPRTPFNQPLPCSSLAETG
jgi:hypothetical protein